MNNRAKRVYASTDIGIENINESIAKTKQIKISLDFCLTGAIDIESDDLQIIYGLIPEGSKKGEGLGKNYVLTTDMDALQCSFNPDDEEQLPKYNQILEICRKIGDLSKQLKDIVK